MTDPVMSPQARIEWIAPARDLRDFVNTLFVFSVGEGRAESMMPAYSAQLFAFARGRAEVLHAGGTVGQSGDIVCNAPLMRAAPLTIEGPLTSIGASFTPLGWAMVSELPVDEVHDATLAADRVFSPSHLLQLETALAELRAGRADERALCQAIEAVLRDLARHSRIVRQEDHRALLGAIEAWLGSSFNPPVAELYGRADISQRQIQRLCKRYFGVPPAQLVKRHRAIRAAMVLAHDDLPGDLRDHAIAAYFDQAHLIRDMRRFTGLTPKQLQADPLARALLDPEGHGRHGEVVRWRRKDA
ncbi:MAG: helix-turn-helix domain-containing protein [Erythrobacter sp.]|jgi:AraC-like DNA-binding protein|nr:helix-turn-helix domain-containing protein [Erythrobacter sp.]